MVFELVADYIRALISLPEAQADVAQQRSYDERLARWQKEITEYVRACANQRDQMKVKPDTPDTVLGFPDIIPSIPQRIGEQIDSDVQEVLSSPSRLDRVRAFHRFTSQQCYSLLELSKQPGFVAQHAFNHASAGPVHEASTAAIQNTTPRLLRCWHSKSRYNPTPSCLQILTNRSHVMAVAVDETGRIALSSSSDKTLQIWDLETGAIIRELKLGSNEIACELAFSKDGRLAVLNLGSAPPLQYTLAVMDVQDGTVTRLDGDAGPGRNIAISADGRYALSGTEKNIYIWNLHFHRLERTLKHVNFGQLAITPAGRLIVDGGRVFDIASGALISKRSQNAAVLY